MKISRVPFTSIPLLLCTFLGFSLSVTHGNDHPTIESLRHGLQGVGFGRNAVFHAFTANRLRGITSHCDSAGWLLRGPAMPDSTMRLRLLDIRGRSATSTGESHILEYLLEAKQDGDKVAAYGESIQLGVLLIAINRMSGELVMLQSYPEINLDPRIPIDCGFGGGKSTENGQYLACVFVYGVEHEESQVQFLGARFKKISISDR